MSPIWRLLFALLLLDVTADDENEAAYDDDAPINPVIVTAPARARAEAFAPSAAPVANARRECVTRGEPGEAATAKLHAPAPAPVSGVAGERDEVQASAAVAAAGAYGGGSTGRGAAAAQTAAASRLLLETATVGDEAEAEADATEASAETATGRYGPSAGWESAGAGAHAAEVVAPTRCRTRWKAALAAGARDSMAALSGGGERSRSYCLRALSL